MARKPRILVVDDEQVVRESLFEWFSEDGYAVEAAANSRDALQKMQEGAWDILLIDIKMPGMDGLELQRKVKEIDPQAAVIIMTAYASVETAVQALKEGAYDYVTKPIDPDDLERLVDKAAEHQRLLRENLQLKEKIVAAAGGGAEDIIGQTLRVLEVRGLIETVAQTDATVLITGESGTGKELVARAIHQSSPRRHMPMVTVSCAGLPEGLVESELFGHEKGAFTGAEYRRKGKFELADGGTVFLDEIGDISPKTQVDLLRVLEEKTITRIGGSRPLPVDFRAIAATNRDLLQAVDSGAFRVDLFYRINVFALSLPPLRERRADIPLLAHHFLRQSARSMGRRACRFAPDAMDVLEAYDWPGNVRELENAVERAVVLQQGEEIRLEDLPLGRPPSPAAVEPVSLAEVEKRHIQAVLGHTGGNISRAARLLAIDRVTLYSKLRKYGLRNEPD